MSKERELFEEYIISKHKNRSPLILTQRIQHGFSENYIVQGVQDCWEAWQAAKAPAVPEVINVGNELQSWVAVWSFKARNDREDYIVVDANLLAEKIEKLTGANA